MKLEHTSVQKLKAEILEILGKHLDLSRHKVFFFGSRVSGRANASSDIDIGIEGPNPISHKVLSNIEDEINALPILYKIEIVDFKRVSHEFREVALQRIESL